MSSSKRAEILEKIKQGFAKPKDLQNDFLILGEETAPKLFTPLSGREKSCYEEEKLHYESTYIRNQLDDKNTHKRNINPKSNSIHKINSSNKINTPTKPFVKKSYDIIVSWMVNKGNNVILGPFSTKEIVNKINNDELQGCSFKRVNDSVYFSYDEFKNEISLPIVDEKEVIDFISKRELNK